MGSVDLDVLRLFFRTHFTVLRLLAMRVRRQIVLPLPPYRPPHLQASGRRPHFSGRRGRRAQVSANIILLVRARRGASETSHHTLSRTESAKRRSNDRTRGRLLVDWPAPSSSSSVQVQERHKRMHISWLSRLWISWYNPQSTFANRRWTRIASNSLLGNS